MYNRGDKITFANNEKMIVVDSILYNKKTFIYAYNEQNEKEVVVLEEVKKGEEIYFKSPTPKEIDSVLAIVISKNKDDLFKIFDDN